MGERLQIRAAQNARSENHGNSEENPRGHGRYRPSTQFCRASARRGQNYWGGATKRSTPCRRTRQRGDATAEGMFAGKFYIFWRSDANFSNKIFVVERKKRYETFFMISLTRNRIPRPCIRKDCVKLEKSRTSDPRWLLSCPIKRAPRRITRKT